MDRWISEDNTENWKGSIWTHSPKSNAALEFYGHGEIFISSGRQSSPCAFHFPGLLSSFSYSFCHRSPLQCRRSRPLVRQQGGAFQQPQVPFSYQTPKCQVSSRLYSLIFFMSNYWFLLWTLLVKVCVCVFFYFIIEVLVGICFFGSCFLMSETEKLRRYDKTPFGKKVLC